MLRRLLLFILISLFGKGCLTAGSRDKIQANWTRESSDRESVIETNITLVSLEKSAIQSILSLKLPSTSDQPRISIHNETGRKKTTLGLAEPDWLEKLSKEDKEKALAIGAAAIGALIFGGAAFYSLKRSNIVSEKTFKYKPSEKMPSFLTEHNIEISKTSNLDQIKRILDTDDTSVVLTSEASLVKIRGKFEYTEVLGKLEDGQVLVGISKESSGLRQFTKSELRNINLESPLSVTSIQKAGIFNKKFSHFIEDVELRNLESVKTVDYPFYMDAFQSLEKLKTNFGARPDTPIPQIKSSKQFLGYPITTVQVWISKAIRKKWFPESFWNFIGKKFGLENGSITHYEFVYSTIMGLHNAKRAQFEINSRLLRNDSPTEFFQGQTGLTFHLGTNSPYVLINSIDDFILLFEAQVKLANKEGRLAEFYREAFDSSDVCFEARARTFAIYAQKHPISQKNAGEFKEILEIVDYGPDPTMSKVFETESMAYGRIHQEKLVDGWQIDRNHFKQYLRDKGEDFYGHVKAKKSGDISFIKEEDVDEFIKANEILFN